MGGPETLRFGDRSPVGPGDQAGVLGQHSVAIARLGQLPVRLTGLEIPTG